MIPPARRTARKSLRPALAAAAAAGLLCGCGAPQWVRNGFKVGPNYVKPTARLAGDWVGDAAAEPRDADAAGEDPLFLRDRRPDPGWWTHFGDPTLERLVADAYANNLEVKAAAYRVMQARYVRSATAGTIFPQTQTFSGGYTRSLVSANTSGVGGVVRIPRYNSSFDGGFDLNWEVDLWGRIRRSIAAADADYEASVEALDDVLVTLVADVASTYMEIRSVDRRLDYARQNVEIQAGTLEINEAKLELGEISALDVEQAKANLFQTKAAVPQLLQSRRQLQNRLSILLGVPPTDLSGLLGEGDIPVVPEAVVVGIPADLLRRRPDVRQAERNVAAQSEQIGIAAAELYPALTLGGAIGLSAGESAAFFRPTSTTGSFAPSVRWNVLNYGQLTNLVRVEEEGLLEQVAIYQSAVLTAQQEVEDAVAQFLYSRRRYDRLRTAVDAASEAVRLGELQWEAGEVDYNQIFTLQSTLVSLQDSLVQSELQAAQGVVEIHRALGGGWEIRVGDCIPDVAYACDPDCYHEKPDPALCRPDCTCGKCLLLH